ncbi:T9SS type A sorting domain-containing protein [Reichenbachiella sp.]|uniref:T9SS type A sorting domain-containing protein n=1 Tax=Reichenbachiella sp. TaxID=2184521 RepID=UPI003BAEE9A0
MKYLKLFTLVFVSLLMAMKSIAQETSKDWVFSSGGQWSDQANAIVTDSQGNIYATGSFQGKMNIKSKTLKSDGDTDIFIAKFNESGELLWAKRAGGKVRKRNTITEFGSDLVLVDDKYLYVTGAFSLIANFENENIESNGQDDVFIAKYTTDGKLEWVRSAGGSSQDIVYALDADHYGNIYLTGSFQKNANFGSFVLESSNLTEMFVAKLTSYGKFEWVKQSSSNSMSAGKSLKCINDYCIIGGEYKGGMKLLNTEISSKGEGDLFFTKLDLEGNLVWLNTLGGRGSEKLGDIDIKKDQIYFVGNSNESFQELPQMIDKDAILGSLSIDGNLNWLKSFGGTGNDLGKTLAITENEEIIISGIFEKNLSIDVYELISTKHQSAFLVSMNSRGDVNWGENLGGSSQHQVNDIGLYNGNVFMTGFMRGKIDLFGEQINSVGSSDMFFLKLNSIYEEKDIVISDMIHVYPNPSEGLFTLQSDPSLEAEDVRIEIFDMQGVLLFSKTYENDLSKDYRVDVSKISSGLYLLEASFDGKSYSKRIIIK